VRLAALVIIAFALAACAPTAPAPSSVTTGGAATPVSPLASPTGDARAAGTAQHPIPITLAMGYIPSVQFAPFYVARERGYFADEGLDVTFRYGMETDLLKLVGTDQLQFMIGSGEEVILGRSQGLPVRYVMRWYRKFPVVLFAKAERGINSVSDLVGKRVGVPGLFGASYVGWEAIVYASGLDASKVSLESIGFSQASAVSQGQVDAAMDYIVNGPVQLRLAGQPVNVFPVSDYIDLPSNGLITNETTIAAHPELVQALVSAGMRGLTDTLADPDAAFEISLRAVPEAGGAQAEVSRAIFDESVKLWQAVPAELGRSDPAAWAKASAFMQDMGLIQSKVAADDCYTNAFVAR